MTDREKVIKWLDVCKTADRAVGLKEDYPCRECPYQDSPRCMRELVADALALLKEQEAKYGYWINPTSQDCHCSECGEQPVHEPGESVPLYDFCPYCGAKMEVKWNE